MTKKITYIIIVSCSIPILAFSFMFQIYEVDYAEKYHPIYVTLDDKIKISISANSTGGYFIWLPFFALVKDHGPYKVVFYVEDKEKKWEKIEIINAEFQDWDEKITKLDLTNKNTGSITRKYSKEIDQNYGTEYFHAHTPNSISLPQKMHVVIEFELSNNSSKKHYKIKTLMEKMNTKNSSWFSFIQA